MAAELLVKNPEDRVLREGCTDRIYSNVHRASRIIENLIKFARPSSDDRRPIDLNETLEATLSLRENQIALQQIELSREFAEDMPPVLGSSSLLQQVFLNIILNAANAMPGGGKLTISTLVNPEGKAEVRFADTGCGIPQEHLDNIFDPFFTTMPAGRGTGLGLSVSYGIIQQHGGSIEVESRVGAGTTFKVILKIEYWKLETLAQTWFSGAVTTNHSMNKTPDRQPLNKAEQKGGTMNQSEIQNPCPPVPGDGRRAKSEIDRILVVDDEPDMSWALENTLKEEGYRITLTVSGKEALRLAKDENFKVEGYGLISSLALTETPSKPTRKFLSIIQSINLCDLL